MFRRFFKSRGFRRGVLAFLWILLAFFVLNVISAAGSPERSRTWISGSGCYLPWRRTKSNTSGYAGTTGTKETNAATRWPSPPIKS